jgi:hypothetical protein
VIELQAIRLRDSGVQDTADETHDPAGIVERVRARKGREAGSAPALRPTARY